MIVITSYSIHYTKLYDGYRAANVADFEKVFTEANGYEVSTFYSLKNDEQLNAAGQFITDGVDYLLISAAATDGWESVLKSAQEAGIKVFLFDRMMNVDESLYEAAVVSDMAQEGITAVEWLKAQNLSEYNVIHIHRITSYNVCYTKLLRSCCCIRHGTGRHHSCRMAESTKP